MTLLQERLEQVFREAFEDDNLVISSDLSQENTNAWDSFQQVKLIIGLQEEFGVQFTTEEAVAANSVEKIRAALAAKGVRE